MMQVQTKKCQSGQHREQPPPCVRQENKILRKEITLSIQPRIQGQRARSHRDAVRVGLGLNNAAESSCQRTED